MSKPQEDVNKMVRDFFHGDAAATARHEAHMKARAAEIDEHVTQIRMRVVRCMSYARRPASGPGSIQADPSVWTPSPGVVMNDDLIGRINDVVWRLGLFVERVEVGSEGNLAWKLSFHQARATTEHVR